MNIVEIFIAIALFSYLIYGIYVLNIAKKNYSKVNLNDLDLIPSMFTTIGILGTFGGIAYGLWFFNPEDIEKSIPCRRHISIKRCRVEYTRNNFKRRL